MSISDVAYSSWRIFSPPPLPDDAYPSWHCRSYCRTTVRGICCYDKLVSRRELAVDDLDALSWDLRESGDCAFQNLPLTVLHVIRRKLANVYDYIDLGETSPSLHRYYILKPSARNLSLKKGLFSTFSISQ